jgi:bacteriorhodopsin
VLAAGVLGLLFLIALTVAIPDLTRISGSGSPVAAILRAQLGPVVETTLLVTVSFAFFACGLVMMATVTLYLTVRKQLDRRKGAFDLGPFELPVAIVALLWLVLALIVLVTPGAALVPVLIVIGLLLVGKLYFLGMLMFDRKSLWTEPGDVPIIAVRN